MEAATIHNLLGAIRDFSNEVTVRALADRLGISYSTLMRCKNGKWPRSLKPSVMRSVIDECRVRFFEGDGTALADSVLMRYQSMDVSPDAIESLEHALSDGGYEEFVTVLIMQASSRRNGTGPVAHINVTAPSDRAQETIVPEATATSTTSSLTADETPAAHALTTAPADEATCPAQDPRPISDEHSNSAPETNHTPGVFPKTTWDAANKRWQIRDFLLGLPLAVVLLMGLLKVSLTDLVVWTAEHGMAFLALSVFIALSPLLCGLFVDSPIAWLQYRKAHPDTSFSWKNFARVAKYGDVAGVVRGAGRFNLTSAYLFHQPLCNILSMMCYIAMNAFLPKLPGFKEFLLRHDWVEYLKVAVVAAFILSFCHMREQLRLPPPDPECEPMRDNPDTFLPTRVHVWANTAHLVWTISILIIQLMGFLAYGIVSFRTHPMPALILWPYLQAMLFFAHACASPLAPQLHTVSVGMLQPSSIALSSAFCLSSLICFLPSPGAAVLYACATLSLGLVHVWTRRRDREEDPAHTWFEDGRSFGEYAVTMTAVILALVVMGLLTSAFS